MSVLDLPLKKHHLNNINLPKQILQDFTYFNAVPDAQQTRNLTYPFYKIGAALNYTDR